MTVIHTTRADEAAKASLPQRGAPTAESAVEPTEVLFPEAKHRERRRRLTVLAIVLAVAGITAGLIASFGGAPPHRTGTATGSNEGKSPAGVVSHFTLRGNGIGAARFGQSQAVAVAELKNVLGAPQTKTLSAVENCTIDSYLEWSMMTAYFFRGRFVGYGTGSLLGEPGHRQTPNATTAAGLRIGDSLAQAKNIYGKSITISGAQGGSWFAATSTGTLAGLLTEVPGHPTPPIPRIANVTAGSVGCPAASP